MKYQNRQQTEHKEQLVRLARIEGQLRGIQKMIQRSAYCIDIVTQIEAAMAALNRVGLDILKKHMERCLVDAARSRSSRAVKSKISEITAVLERRSRLKR